MALFSYTHVVPLVCTIFLHNVICHDVENCRYVTIPVCGDQEVSTTLVRENQGQYRREAGPPGKSGPKGSDGQKGQKGDRGVPGIRGANADPQVAERTIDMKVQELRTSMVSMSGVDFCKESTVAGIHLVHGKGFVCDGKGWMIIQHRRDGSVNFERNWNEYKDGFGSLDGEFWFGLHTIHKVMRGRDCQLRIELESFEREQAYAEYSTFVIDDEEKKYRLSISGYNGTAGDSMSFHDGMVFTTKDRDNDMSGSNCAGTHGGWWFKNCFRASPNAVWGRSTGTWSRIIWYTWKGDSTALDHTTMKIRCKEH
ncbi:fibrinogen C domain-containing protein 1-like [Styela clava]